MTFDRVLSAVRALMAKELVARGLSVNETARLLGLTPAAVSMYISGKRGRVGGGVGQRRESHGSYQKPRRGDFRHGQERL